MKLGFDNDSIWLLAEDVRDEVYLAQLIGQMKETDCRQLDGHLVVTCGRQYRSWESMVDFWNDINNPEMKVNNIDSLTIRFARQESQND